jgi:hypothetical protein
MLVHIRAFTIFFSLMIIPAIASNLNVQRNNVRVNDVKPMAYKANDLIDLLTVG